jgi:hypothetical protein
MARSAADAGVDDGVDVDEGGGVGAGGDADGDDDVDEGGGVDVGVGAGGDDDVGEGGDGDEGVDGDVDVDGGVNRCTIVRPPLDAATGAGSCQDIPTKNPTPNASGAMINTSRNSLSDLGSEII